MKIEDNSVMKASYLLIDEFGRFLDSSLGSKIPTESILEVGLEKAYSQLVSGKGGGFDRDVFMKRDGMYEKDGWSKASRSPSCNT